MVSLFWPKDVGKKSGQIALPSKTHLGPLRNMCMQHEINPLWVSEICSGNENADRRTDRRTLWSSPLTLWVGVLSFSLSGRGWINKKWVEEIVLSHYGVYWEVGIFIHPVVCYRQTPGYHVYQLWVQNPPPPRPTQAAQTIWPECDLHTAVSKPVTS